MSKLSILAVWAIIFSSMSVPAYAQEPTIPFVWEEETLSREVTVAGISDSVMEVWEPTVAESPTLAATSASTTQDVECYWAEVADELLPTGAINLVVRETSDAYSGTKVFERATTAESSSLSINTTLHNQQIVSVFVRYWFKLVPNTGTGGEVKSITNYGGTQVVVSDSPSSDSFISREILLDMNKLNQTDGAVGVQIAIKHVGLTIIQLDQVGIGYCIPARTEPDISLPAEVGQLYTPLLFFGGQFFHHGGPLSVILDNKGLKSFELLCQEGTPYQALCRRFGPGMNPKGVTEGIYLGDKLWGSKNPSESLLLRQALTRSRQTSTEGLSHVLQTLEQRLASQIQTGAKPENLEYTRFMIQFTKDKIRYLDQLIATGKSSWANLPINLIFEMRDSALSRTFDGGRYQYVKSGEMLWRNLRGIEFPEGTENNVVREAYNILVSHGAPSRIKLVIGAEEMRIGAWVRWTGSLKNWAIPQIMATGQSLFTNLWVNARVGLWGTAAMLPEIGLYAGSALVGDVLGTSYVYLMSDETSLSYDQFLASESLTAWLLTGADLMPANRSSQIGTVPPGQGGFFGTEFCIPETDIVLTNYSYQLVTIKHPNVCSGMGWKIFQEVPEVGLILEKDNGLPVGVPFAGSTTYSMVSYSYDNGTIWADFVLNVIRYDATNKQAEIGINFAGFRTAQDVGLCPSWLPPSKAQEMGRNECPVMPYAQYLPVILGR